MIVDTSIPYVLVSCVQFHFGKDGLSNATMTHGQGSRTYRWLAKTAYPLSTTTAMVYPDQ